MRVLTFVRWPARSAGAAAMVWLGMALLLAAAPALAAGADDPVTFANGLYQRKLYSLAAPEFEKFLRANPEHASAGQAAYRLAECYRRTQDWAKAAPAYARALAKYPIPKFTDDARLALGQCYFELGQLDKAAAAYATLLAKSKDRKAQAQAQYWLGEVEFGRKHYAQAEAAYSAVVEKYTDAEVGDLAPFAYYSLGVCAADRGDPQAAIKALQQVVNRFPHFASIDEVRVRLGDALRALKRYPEAREQYVAASGAGVDSTLRSAALLGGAYCAMESKDYAAALAAAKECSGLVNADSRARAEVDMLLSGARYALKQYAEALDGYLRIASGDQADLAEEGIYWAGNTYRRLNRHANALAQFEQLLKRFPNGAFAARAQLRIGDCEVAAGRPDAAAAAYRVVMERFPDTDAAREAQAALGDIVARAGSATDSGALTRVVNLLPAGSIAADAQLQLAHKEFAAGRYQEAADWAAKVLNGKPGEQATEQAYYLQGAARLQLKDAAGAVQCYSELVNRFPNGKLVNQALLELSWAYLDLKQPAEAVRSTQRLLQHNPEGDLRVNALLTLAEAATAAGLYAETEVACERVMAANPKPEDAVTALYAYAWAAHRQKRWEPAAARWQKLLDKTRAIPDSPLAPRAADDLGVAFTHRKRYGEAVPGRVKAAPGRGELGEQARYDLGWNYVEMKQPERAAAEFEKLATDYPAGRYAAEALFLAGEQAFAQKEYRTAAARYRRAEALKPEGDLAFKVAMQMGVALYYVPEYPGAAAAFARAAGLAAGAKEAAEATYWAGDAWAKANDWPQARPFFEKYLEMAPAGDRLAAACLGGARAALAADDAARAVALVERGLPGAKGDMAAELQLRMGDALLKQGNAADAATAYMKVSVLYPESPKAAEAQWQAGQVFENQGEKTRAAELYRGLVEKYPQSKEAALAKARLTALGGQ